MDRSEFFKSLVAIGIAPSLIDSIAKKLVIAPKIKVTGKSESHYITLATTDEASQVAPPAWVKKYAQVKTKSTGGLFPWRIEQGQNGRHTLFFTGPMDMPLMGCLLMDENGMTYFVAGINRINPPEVEVMIMDLDSEQTKPKGVRSRRRGLMPRRPSIGKEYVVYNNACPEGNG